MRVLSLLALTLITACGGWDSTKNLDALDDQELEALCSHFYDLAGGAERQETCSAEGLEYRAVLGARENEIAACKAKQRPACTTQLLEDCVSSLNGSLCADMNTDACRKYVDCELGT
jgi:hypothetical protein